MTAIRSMPGRSMGRFAHRAAPQALEGAGASDDRGDAIDEGLATFLGGFSIALGLVEVLAPYRFNRAIGLRTDGHRPGLTRLFGLREIASGVGLLARPRPATWAWARVAGDALDLAALGEAMTEAGTDRRRIAAATAAVVGVTALDIYAGVRLSRRAAEAGWNRVDVRHSVTIARPAEELYRFWRDFENLPQFMNHLESVRDLGGGRSHWTAKAPAGMTVEWDAEVADDVPGQRIAWRSLPGGDVENDGSVRFVPAPGGRGTEVHVDLRYDPPGGTLGSWFARLFGENPDQQVYDDLRAFKQVMEIGEVVRSDGTAGGGRYPQHPAQPVAGG